MSVKDIERAISQLSPEDLQSFRNWFREFDAEAWDRQFDSDVAAGRLEKLADDALRELDRGRCTDL